MPIDEMKARKLKWKSDIDTGATETTDETDMISLKPLQLRAFTVDYSGSANPVILSDL